MGSKFVQLVTIITLIALGTALSCNSNQYYNNDVSCIDCPQNCSTCSNSQFCTSCKDNFFLVSNAFNVTCQTCSQIYYGCKTCLANVACTKCSEGFFLNNGACSLCAVRNIFCILCSEDGRTCTQCSYPFALVNGLCISATVSDITGGSSGSTDANNSTNSDNTTNTTTYITLSNGTKVPEVLDANKCNQIQIFFQGRCMKLIDNCIYYQPSGLCGYCATGYLVTIFGDCSVKNRFLSCEPGFWLNRNLDVCVKANPACDWYFPTNGSCINCSAGYKWVNYTCVMNVSCNSRQYFYQGVCIDQPAACITFTSDGACTTCAVGYDLKSGICRTSENSVVRGSNCEFPCQTCHESNKKYCFSCVIYY